MPGTIQTAVAQEKLLPRLRRAFWIGAGALIGVGLTFALAAWLNSRNVQLVLESQRSGRLAREIRSLALDRETSVRGYLLSHQPITLERELAARAPLNSKLDSLVLLSADNASQQDRARAIRNAVKRWERGFALPALSNNTEVAEGARESLAGRELFDAIRGAVDSFLNGEQRIFSMRVRMLSAMQQFTTALLLLEIAALLLTLLWLRRRSLTQARLLIDQQRMLQTQSLDLQQQALELEEQAMELEEQADEANRNANALTETNLSLEETIRRLEESEATISNVTSVKEVTESLLNVVLDKAPVGVILYNENREVVRVNPALEVMTGLMGQDHAGKTLDQLASEELAETVDRIILDVLETGESVMNVPLSGTNTVDRTRERHFLCSYFPITLPGKRPGVGGVVVETTQFRQLEEQLLMSQKMEAVGRLAGGVAHDFNNMLTAIMSYSDLILADMPPESPLRNDMVEIVKAAEKATALTRKLLAFSRQQVLRPARVDLNTTIEGLRKMMKRLLGTNVDLSLNLAPGVWTVSADPTELERVLMNLVLNSRDAMPDGGKLIVETVNVVIDEEYASQHADTTPGEYAMIAVTDTGAGMTKEVKDKVFEPFFTTKEKGKGTGLGLPSVYGIVKQSGGFLWVYSELGKGTTFKVYLPRATDTQQSSFRTPNKNRTIGSETILLVEDDAEVRQVASRILRRNGYRVLEADNGAEALKVCEGEEDAVDLIVTDLVMPEMGGSELAERIRENQPDARILFTSGYTEDAVVRQSLLHAGEAFLEKPFTPAKLANKARELLRGQEEEV